MTQKGKMKKYNGFSKFQNSETYLESCPIVTHLF